MMIQYSNKFQVCTYVDKETYEFLCNEKGLAAMSVYMRALINDYKNAVLSNEIPEHVNIN